ncbi:MAG: hypothetical protein K2Q26_14540 [Bdellovibrionales bacterium]|nr:hypothetical protein [Bdellovibrionales bacterium]
MAKSKALIYDTLVDVVLKNGEELVGYINKERMQKESERDFVKLSNKKVTKGVRSVEKRIKTTQIASIAKSKATAPNF